MDFESRIHAPAGPGKLKSHIQGKGNGRFAISGGPMLAGRRFGAIYLEFRSKTREMRALYGRK